MYRVYCDEHLLYDDRLENLKIFNPSVELELNKTGSFIFTVYPDHPYLPFIQRQKSIITIWQDDFLLFRGRVLDDDVGWHNERTFTCEGDLSFLFDSIQRPFSFTGSVADFLNFVVEAHNSQVDEEKQFKVGSVTVTGDVTADVAEYPSTWETVQKNLMEPLGGYLITRQTGGVNYIDYLSGFNVLAPQKITFWKNLLDMKRSRRGAVYTAVIPLGAKLKDENGNETGERLTIKSVNNGLDYLVDEDAKAQFGFAVKTVYFDDITDPALLLKAGQKSLIESVNLLESIELTAADLSTIDKSVTSFHLGTQVYTESGPHGLDQRMLVTKLSLKLFEPLANKLVLGNTIKAFSEVVVFQKGDPGQPGQPGIPGKDGVDGRDGIDGIGVASITEQYYLSTSATALSGGSWSNTVPTWVNERFMWTKSVIQYTNGTTSNTDPKCVTGAKGSSGSAGTPGSDGKDGISITNVDVMYYQSTSATALSGSSWVTTAPVWVDGRFFWEKTVVTYSDGTTHESDPVCITGQRGLTGTPGAKGDPGSPGENGKDAAVQSLAAPSDTSYLWLDISVDPPLLKRYDTDTALWVVVNNTSGIVYNLEQNLTSSIEKSETDIKATVAETYTLKEDAEAMVSEVRTEVTLTKESFEVEFTRIEKDIEDVKTGADAEFEEIKKYFRFVDGKILLGEVGNKLELVIANDRISFQQDGAEVAYFSDRKLHVTDGEYTHSLKIGNFSFVPRANGNLSFKKA